MKSILIAACLVVTMVAAANAVNIAFWDFNDSTNITGVTTDLWRINPLGTTASPTAYAKDLGSGTVAKLSTWGSSGPVGNLVGNNGDLPTPNSNNNFGTFTGTTLNDIKGTPVAGSAFSITGSGNNLHYFLIELDDAIANGLLSYATRGTSTGYGTHTLDYSVNGGTTWSALDTHAANKTATWAVHTVNLGNIFASTSGSAMNLIRLTVDGATSANGNNRFDNILITGDIVPEPATLTLLALSGLLIRRRRAA